MTPEKLHLALNHLPFLACAFGMFPLLIGILMRQRILMLCGFFIVGVGCLSTTLVMESGEEAYERYKAGPVTAYLDAGAEAALETHEHMAEDMAKVFIATGLSCLLGLAFAIKKPELSRKIAMATVLLCVVSVVAGVQISNSGGKIRRPDFRTNAGTVQPTGQDTDHDD